MQSLLKKLDNKVTYMAVTVAALGFSVLVLTVMLLSGDASAHAEAHNPTQSASPAVLSTLQPSPAAPLPSQMLDVQSGDKLPLTVEVTDGTASGLLRTAVEQKIDVERLDVNFLAPDTMRISLGITKAALAAFVEAEDIPMSALLMLLAPKRLQLDIEVALSLEEEGLRVEAKSVETNGFNLSAHLPDGIVSMANDALKSALPADMTLGGIIIEDGRALFTLMV